MFEPNPNPHQVTPHPAAPPPPPGPAPLRILHLEDNPDDVELVKATLASDGLACEILTVNSRQQFEHTLTRQPFDLILSDYALPSYDGITALQTVRAKFPSLPFILVSGTLGEEQAVESLKNGATDYILKTRLLRLPAAVRRALSAAATQRQYQLAEEKLQQSHALFCQITENIEDLVAVLDLAGQRIYSSPSYARLLGPTACAPHTDSFAEIHPDDVARIRTLFAHTIATGHGQQTEYRFVLPDGSVRYIESQGSVIRNQAGQVAHVLVVSRDITARRRAGELLRLQEAALRSTANVVIITDRAGLIVWTNPAFTKVTGYSAPEVLGQNPRLLQRGGPPNAPPAAYYQNLWATITRGEVWQGEFQNRRKDGTELIEEAIITPVRDEQGALTHYVAVKQDITERKHAEARLAAAQKELVELSRQAGMAEVATGVLHNVGNVLNSVNVAAHCLAEGLRHSKSSSLVKVVTLLRAHEADLAHFIAHDPKGQQLPTYLAKLADHLVAEQTAALTELAQLQKNIEHIKDIVAMQQCYAQVSGLTETVALRDLVEDALLMSADSLGKADIKIRKEFAIVPTVIVQRHKVLQVLVNLIRNAKHACEASDCEEKLLTLRIMHQANRVCVSIQDNGVGIPSENLTRIFSHGFTTKKDGHGFGLHSGALAVKEMGGSLQVHSAGAGQGATFTLELPILPPGATESRTGPAAGLRKSTTVPTSGTDFIQRNKTP